jgi:hypothetical protein
LVVISLGGTEFLHGASSSDHPGVVVSASGSAQRPLRDVTGTWSGTFQSRQPSFSPFTITVVIHAEPDGRLTGDAHVSTDCLGDGTLVITGSGSDVVMAGGDEDNNHVTFEGTVDQTGTLIEMKYVLKGGGARCESDDGTGTMVKR